MYCRPECRDRRSEYKVGSDGSRHDYGVFAVRLFNISAALQ